MLYRIVDQPKTSIKEALDRGLAWLRRRYPAGQGHNTRLDARFRYNIMSLNCLLNHLCSIPLAIGLVEYCGQHYQKML